MTDYIDIVRNYITRACYRPVDPKHWIVRVVFDEGMTEFKRGGIMTEQDAHDWAKCLMDDYPDATEIVLYELTTSELAEYKAQGWK